jgi:CubicO group peptidase (beta-lactamase class C family)
MIAAAMVERRLDVDFESSIVAQLLRPLGMKTVGFGAAGGEGKEDEPWGHLPTASSGMRPIPPGPDADLPSIYDPAGTVHMTIGDWGLWIRTILCAEARLASPWKPETAQKLTSRVVEVDSTDAYGFGWAIGTQTWDGRGWRILGHNGSNGMNFASVRVIPDAGFGVIVIANQGGAVATNGVVATVDRLMELYRTGRQR